MDESPQLIADRRVLVPESQGECIAATGKPWWGRNWPEEGVVPGAFQLTLDTRNAESESWTRIRLRTGSLGSWWN